MLLLDETKTYSVAVNDFMSRGGDNYVMCRDAKHVVRDYDGPLMANEVMAYLRKPWRGEDRRGRTQLSYDNRKFEGFHSLVLADKEI